MLKRFKIRMLLGLLLVSALTGELVVRMAEAVTGKNYAIEFVSKLTMSDSLYMPHPYVGFVPRPGAQSPEHSIEQYSVNSLGFRGAEFPQEKAPGTFRVACVGGSTTWGGGSSNDARTWPAILERRLTAALPENGPYDRVEVINAGVPGYTLMDSFVNFKMRVAPLQPDLVIVYHAINDARVIGRPGFKPDYTHVRRPWRIPVPSSADTLLGWSHLYGMLRGGQARTVELFDFVYVRNFDQQLVTEWIDEGLETWRRTLSELVATARTDGAEVLLTSFTWTTEYPIETKWQMEAGLRTVARINAVTVNVAKRQHTPFVHLRGSVANDAALFVDPVHLSDRGNWRVATLLALGIRDTGLLEGTYQVPPMLPMRKR